MELRNALAVCLIALFSATLVLLIARSLDSRAASRLEPQLARIVEELEAIRKSGGITAGPGVAAETEPVDDALMVYYFHGNTRCRTCRSIESQAHATVESEFASELESGRVVWKTVNYEEPSGTELGEEFEVQMPVVVLANMNGGHVEDWKSLDQVWALVGDKPAFAEYIRDEVNHMLETDPGESTAASPESGAEPPLPAADASDLPVPEVGVEPDVRPEKTEASGPPRASDAPGNALRRPGPPDTSAADRSPETTETR
ncbi:MAG: nitrophenyl compound nitroreductase subunit ArsF family protein [Planctomycetota bacterium]